MAVWQWRWKPRAGEAAPGVTLCSLLYGKTGAYSFEIDDGPAATATVALPLLAGFSFTDAPSGVSGGKRLPLVGGAAVFPLRVGTGNEAFLEGAQLRQLERAGWAVLNHGYAHRGYGWDPKGALTGAQLQEELYWSQVVLAAERESQRSPAHFVYPNGYMAYQPHLSAFGLRSASRVAGKKARLSGPAPDWLDLDRNYLDESVWSKTPDPLLGLPRAFPPGEWVIDFTHNIEADPNSANHRRWRERLTFLTGRGDALWCAPTPTVVAYAQARQAATVTTKPGRVVITLPDTLPGSRLTLKLTGMAEGVPAPPGCTLYRQGETTWLTTPVLGTPDIAPPAVLERVYRGPAQDVRLPKARRIAGVRLLQRKPTRPDYRLTLALTTSTGPHVLADAVLEPNWGNWFLYALCPNQPAVVATGLTISPDPGLTGLELWALA